MIKILIERFKQGYRTIPFPIGKLPVLSARYRGRPIVAGQYESVDTGKISFTPDSGITHSNCFQMASSTRKGLIVQKDQAELIINVNKEIVKMFGRSLKLRQVSAGGCNACELDINVLNTPVFDLSRFGIQFTASPLILIVMYLFNSKPYDPLSPII